MTRDALCERAAGLIARLADGERDDAGRDALLRDAIRFQRQAMPVYARMLSQLAIDDHADPLTWPAIPCDVFRYARVAAHPPAQDIRVFRTSGTTGGARGSHALRTLELYDRAAEAAARYALFPDVKRMPLVVLAPAAAEAEDSSLSYMLERFGAWFGEGSSAYAFRAGRLDVERLEQALRVAERKGEAVALLGTSFAFVHAEDALGTRRFRLAPGSRIMQTGGFKGRSREIEPLALSAALAARYDVDPRCIVQEYGMTELSSQLYDLGLRSAVLGTDRDSRELASRALWVPGWVRATPVDPESLRPVPRGEVGLLRIDDLANLDSPCAIQTSDHARVTDYGLELLGRVPGATPRGCSLALDAALGG